jgi:hypothetical protein
MRHIGRGRAIRHSSGQRIPGGSRSKHKKGNAEFYNEKSKRTKINTHKFLLTKCRVIQEWKNPLSQKEFKKINFRHPTAEESDQDAYNTYQGLI